MSSPSFAVAAIAGPSLAAEPLQPEGALATEAGGANAAPSDSEANTDEQAGASDAAGESAGKDASAPKEYRHRPGACPEGPPCKSE